LDNTVLNHAGRECFIVNNLFADIPIPEAFFTCFSGWKARCEDGNIFVERTAAQENNT